MRLSLARRIVGFYPPAWRRRYGEELHALLDEQSPNWGHVIDLVLGCGRQWRATLVAGNPPSLAGAIVLAAGAALMAFGISAIVALNGTWLGLLLRQVTPVPPGAVDLAFALDALVWLRVLTAFAARLTTMPKAMTISQAEAPVWVSVMVAAAALRVWSGESLALQVLQNTFCLLILGRPTASGAEPGRG